MRGAEEEEIEEGKEGEGVEEEDNKCVYQVYICSPYSLNIFFFREDTIDPLFCTLRHMTSEASEVGAAARQRLSDLRAIPLCADLLIRSRCWPVVKAGAGLVRNLLSHYSTHEEMVDMNIIPR